MFYTFVLLLFNCKEIALNFMNFTNVKYVRPSKNYSRHRHKNIDTLILVTVYIERTYIGTHILVAVGIT